MMHDITHLNGDDKVSLVLQEVGGIDGDYSGLIRLCHISKYDVHHAKQHPILMGMSGILDDRDDISPLLGHIDEVSA